MNFKKRINIFGFNGNKVILLVLFSIISFQSSAKEYSLRQQLESIQKSTGIGAVSYALVEKNRIVETGGIGHYGLDNSQLVTADSLFRVGSITKTFTALAVMHQVEKGLLKLDDKVKKFIPDIPLNNPWPKNTVTLEMLLEHTSGLQDLSKTEFNYPEPLSLQRAFSIKPEARKLAWQAGYHFSYSNVGAGYVGRVIETVTREEYDSWFEREILNTLAMSDSQLHWTAELEHTLVTGYDSDLKTKLPYWHTLFRPFGGLNTTASDMAKFLLLFTQDNNVLSANKNLISPASIKRMETPSTSLAAKVGLKRGYGLAIRNEIFKGYRIYGHGGDGDGYLAKFSYSKQSQRGYFVVINGFRHDILTKFTGLLNQWLIENLPNPKLSLPIHSIKQLSKKEKQEILGDYREITARFPGTPKKAYELLRIKTINEDLFRCFPTLRICTKIITVTKNLFREETENNASMAFIKANDGRLYFQAEFGNYQKFEEK